MSKRSNRELLRDILEAIDKIKRYTQGMSYRDFVTDEKTQDAVVRNFEIIGEAANRVDKKVKSSYPGIAWRRIIGLRHRVVHEYFGIDLRIIWNITEQNLDQFKTEIQEVLQQLDQD